MIFIYNRIYVCVCVGLKYCYIMHLRIKITCLFNFKSYC